MRRYRVHDLLRIAVDDDPRASEPFLKWLAELPQEPNPGATPADITWLAESSLAPDSRDGQLETARDAAGRWHCSGDGHNMVAIVQHCLLERDASLAHACGLVVRGKGVLVAGHSGSGKTAMTLAALDRPDVQVLSDDFVVVGRRGAMLSFPTPIALYPAHAGLLPDQARALLRAAESRRKLLAALRRPLGGLGRALKRFLAGGGPGGRFAAGLNTRYVPVSPALLLSDADRVAESQLSLTCVLERTDAGFAVERREAPWGRKNILAMTYGDHDVADAVHRYESQGVVDAAWHFERAAAVMSAALATAPVIRVRIPEDWSLRRMQESVLGAVAQHSG